MSPVCQRVQIRPLNPSLTLRLTLNLNLTLLTLTLCERLAGNLPPIIHYITALIRSGAEYRNGHVCLSVCSSVCVCTPAYLRNHTHELYRIFTRFCGRVSVYSLAALQCRPTYVGFYFRFCGWHYIFPYLAHWRRQRLSDLPEDSSSMVQPPSECFWWGHGFVAVRRMNEVAVRWARLVY